jgi:nicotinamide mononucleotide adenylyltransferase
MYSSFKQFLVEEEKTVYFTFGRMNPPTIGHGKLLDALSKKASKNPYRVFLSQSADPKKNPLSYQDKIKAVRKMFPRHARSIMLNKNVRNAMEAASVMYNEGFKNLVMVVGSDRMNEFSALL